MQPAVLTALSAERVCPVLHEPTEVIEISDDSNKDTSTISMSGSKQSSEAPPLVSASYYTFVDIPLALALPGVPPPVVHKAHLNALIAALKNRAKFIWVVIRGAEPRVYESM